MAARTTIVLDTPPAPRARMTAPRTVVSSKGNSSLALPMRRERPAAGTMATTAMSRLYHTTGGPPAGVMTCGRVLFAPLAPEGVELALQAVDLTLLALELPSLRLEPPLELS
jgi:hypothetical protein